MSIQHDKINGIGEWFYELCQDEGPVKGLTPDEAEAHVYAHANDGDSTFDSHQIAEGIKLGRFLLKKLA